MTKIVLTVAVEGQYGAPVAEASGSTRLPLQIDHDDFDAADLAAAIDRLAAHLVPDATSQLEARATIARALRHAEEAKREQARLDREADKRAFDQPQF